MIEFLNLCAIVLLIFVPMVGMVAEAYEVDDFYCSQKLLNQKAEVAITNEAKLNAFVEEKIREAVQAVNLKIQEEIEEGKVNHTTCNDWGTKFNYMIKAIRDRLSSGLVSELERYASENLVDGVCHVNKSDSIYAGYSDGIFSVLSVLDLLGAGVALGDSVKICGVVVGTDKLGHFFGEGKDLLAYGKDSNGGFSYKSAIRQNMKAEDGVLGKNSTGVRATGDVLASIYGAHFYSSIISGRGGLAGDKPKIYCGQKLVKINGVNKKIPAFGLNQEVPFNWCNYINHGWDESINCSEFTPEMQTYVDKNMADKGYKCPRDTKLCQQAYEKIKGHFYGSTKGLLHPSCVAHGAGAAATKPVTAPGSN